MSEALLYDISQQLRLLARRTCQVDATGRLLAGCVNPVIERVRLQVLSVLEALQDGRPAPGSDHILATAREIVAVHHLAIRELRRAVYA